MDFNTTDDMPTAGCSMISASRGRFERVLARCSGAVGKKRTRWSARGTKGCDEDADEGKGMEAQGGVVPWFDPWLVHNVSSVHINMLQRLCWATANFFLRKSL